MKHGDGVRLSVVWGVLALVGCQQASDDPLTRQRAEQPILQRLTVDSVVKNIEPSTVPSYVIGNSCLTSADCEGGTCEATEGRFPGGYCTMRGCSRDRACPTGSSCYDVGEPQRVCLRHCDAHTDCRNGYACHPVGVCWRAADDNCTDMMCGEGQFCSTLGRCIDQEEMALPHLSPAACDDIPDWRCEDSEEECGKLVPFEPVLGDGYWNYPLNGETEENQYRSFVRRDLMLLIKHAAAYTRCVSESWAFGNGEPLGLGDMSEGDGAIPGTSIGSPGHPPGTHTNGTDMDIGYYQLGAIDNKLRPVCDHVHAGQDQYHCVNEPDILDPWRTAAFIGKLHVSPQLRVIGVDGKVGPLIWDAMIQLCRDGWLTGPACTRPSVTWEETDQGRGWFRFHHHHLHVSIRGQRAMPPPIDDPSRPPPGEEPRDLDPEEPTEPAEPAEPEEPTEPEDPAEPTVRSLGEPDKQTGPVRSNACLIPGCPDAVVGDGVVVP